MQSVQLAASEIWGTLLFFVILYLFSTELNQKKTTKALLIACMTRLVSDAISWAFDETPGLFFGLLTRASNYVTFVSNDVISLVFSIFVWQLVKGKEEKPGLLLKAYWALEVISIAALTLNLHFGWFYSFDSANVYSRGTWYQLTHVAPLASLGIILWLLAAYHQRFSKNQKVLGWTYFFLMAGATFYELFNFGLSLQTYAQTFSALMAFMVVEIDLRQNLVTTKQQLEQKNARLKVEEKKVEAALKAEQLKTDIISSIAAAYKEIVILDFTKKEYYVLSEQNQEYHMTGQSGSFEELREELFKKSIAADYEANEDIRRFLDLDTVQERLKDKNLVLMEIKSVHGTWNSAAFLPKKRDEKGNVLDGMFLIRDISEQKIKELKTDEALKDQQNQLSLALSAAQQANKAKTMFLNSMSHDIRTPMNAIVGFTALAQTHIDHPDQVQDYLAKINTSSTHLLSLINDILDMSRIESGSVKLDEKPVHIPDLLHDLRTMIQGLIHAKQQNLYIDTQDVQNEDVITDKLRLNQVLINIVGNAIKFTPVGGDIIIHLAEKPCSAVGYTTYEFAIKDTGIGMSPEFLGHVFDTFARERSTTVSGIQGTGLGMAITKNIVDMMGGTISVTSEEGKGSTFIVTLTLRLSDHPVQYKPITALKGARALVVDDDVETCRSVCKMLRSIEMQPDWTVTGKEAILRAQDASEINDEYKVYIVDYLMPDMNGIETIRRIRKVIREDVPIIVLTAYDWSDFEKEAREAGVTAFVAKPLFMSELRTVLTQPLKVETPKTEISSEHYDYAGKRILLVEDNELNREIATELLGETGMTIDCATDGIEAVNIINTSPEDTYDAILMDIQMPRMDGYTATREIRTLANNRKANIPIVAMTANAFEEDRRKAFECGMNGHIVKPFDMKVVMKTLHQIWGN